jgi:drug/metabolite transporter (DMT)-like permease
LAIKITVTSVPPFFGASIRFFAAALMLIVIITLKRLPFQITRKTIWPLILSAILMYLCDYGLIYWGEQHISAGVTAIFFSTFPLFTAIWSALFLKDEKLRWNRTSGLVIGFLGIIIVFYDQVAMTQFNLLVVLASLAVTVAAASGAGSVIIVKKHLTHLNAFNLTLNPMVVGIIFHSLFGIIVEDIGQAVFSQRVILAIAYLGFVGSAFAFVLYYHLLKKMSVITLSLIIYITPIIAIIVDYIIFREILHIRSIIGMCVVFIGIALTQINTYTPHRK